VSVQFSPIKDIAMSANTGLDAIKRAPIVAYDTGIKCLRIQDVSQSKAFSNWGFTDVEERNYKKFQLKENDILIARTGASIGVNRFISEDAQAVFNNGLIRVRVDTKKCFPKYLFYNFRTTDYQGFIESISGGTSTQPNMQIGALLSFEIYLPELEEQKTIASILSSLDDKIDLLHRQNTTLERMAETLFRQWFIEEAQEDWEECTLDDLISVKGGTTPSTKEPSFWNGNVNWTSPRDLSNQQSVFMFDTERKISEKGLAQIGSGLLPAGTVLMSSRAPIGYLAISDIPVAINQGYIAIICDKLVSNYFMYLWCKVNMEQIKNAGNGSTFEEISKSNFKELVTIKPSQAAILKFDTSVEPVFAKIKMNQKQILILEKLRNNLLPKLMSGEIKLS
jgi:type I restriction enzyme, S subunit